MHMKLQEYLDTYGIKIVRFAKKIGKSRTWIYKVMGGHIPHASDAVLIEKATEGKVTKEELLFPTILRDNIVYDTLTNETLNNSHVHNTGRFSATAADAAYGTAGQVKKR